MKMSKNMNNSGEPMIPLIEVSSPSTTDTESDHAVPLPRTVSKKHRYSELATRPVQVHDEQARLRSEDDQRTKRALEREKKLRTRILADASSRQNKYVNDQRDKFAKLSSVKLNNVLIAHRVLSPTQLNTMWYQFSANGGNSDAYPAFYRKYFTVLKGANLQDQSKELIRDVQPNPLPGAGYGVGALNVQPAQYDYTAKPNVFSGMDDCLNYWDRVEKIENPILDKTHKLSYVDTLRYLNVIWCAGLKFSDTPYGAWQFMINNIADQTWRMDPLAITAKAGKAKACKGIDNVSDLKTRSEYRTSNPPFPWKTGDLLRIASEPTDPLYEAARKELAYRSSAAYETNWLKLVNSPPGVQIKTWSERTKYSDPPWIGNYDKETRQQQANVKWLCAMDAVPTAYRPSINIVSYNVSIYYRFTAPTAEQLALIKAIGIAPMKNMPAEPQVTPVQVTVENVESEEKDNIDAILDQQFSYTCGDDDPKQPKEALKPPTIAQPPPESASDGSNIIRAVGVNLFNVSEHTSNNIHKILGPDFSYTAKDKPLKIVDQSLVQDKVGSGKEKRLIPPSGFSVDDEPNGEPTRTLYKEICRKRGMAPIVSDPDNVYYALLIINEAEQLAFFNDITNKQKFLSLLNSCIPGASSQYDFRQHSQRELFIRASYIEFTDDPIVEEPEPEEEPEAEESEDEEPTKTAPSIFNLGHGFSKKFSAIKKGVMHVAAVTQSIHDAGTIEEVTQTSRRLNRLLEKFEREGASEKVLKTVEELQPALVNINRVSQRLLTDDSLAQLNRLIPKMEESVNISHDILKMIEPMVKGFKKYLPKPILEAPSMKQVIRDFPYMSFLAVLFTYKKTESAFLRYGALVNFAVQIGVLDLVATVLNKAWEWITSNTDITTETAETYEVDGESLTEQNSLFTRVLSWIAENSIPVGLVSVVCATIAGFYLCRTPTEAEVGPVASAIHKDVVGMGKVAAGVGWILTAVGKIKDIAQHFLCWIYELITGSKWSKPKPADFEKVQSLTYAANFYNTSAGKNQMVGFKSHREHAHAIWLEFQHLHHEALSRDSRDPTRQLCNAVKREFEELKKGLDMAMFQDSNIAKPRPTPLVIAFVGKSGVGKTRLSADLAFELAKRLFSVEGASAEEILKRVASLSTTEFQDAVTAMARIGIIDDFNSFNSWEALKEYLTLVSNAPSVVNKAAVDEKGLKVRFQVIIQSSNRETLRAEGVNEPVAFDRRRHLMFRTILPPEFYEQGRGGRGQAVKSGALAAWRAKYREEHGKEPHEWEHAEFLLVNPVDPSKELPADHMAFKLPNWERYGLKPGEKQNPMKYHVMVDLIVEFFNYMNANEATESIDVLQFYREEMELLEEAARYYLNPMTRKGLEKDTGRSAAEIRKLVSEISVQLQQARALYERQYNLYNEFAERNKIKVELRPVPDIKFFLPDEPTTEGETTETAGETEAVETKKVARKHWKLINTGENIYYNMTDEPEKGYTLYNNKGNVIWASLIENYKDVLRGRRFRISKRMLEDGFKSEFPIESSFSVFYHDNTVQTPCCLEFWRRITPVSETEFIWHGEDNYELEKVRDTQWFLRNCALYSLSSHDPKLKLGWSKFATLMEISMYVDDELEYHIRESAGNLNVYLKTHHQFKVLKRKLGVIWNCIPSFTHIVEGLYLLMLTGIVSSCIYVMFATATEVFRDEVYEKEQIKKAVHDYETAQYARPGINHSAIAQSKTQAAVSRAVAVKPPSGTAETDSLFAPDPSQDVQRKVISNTRIFQLRDSEGKTRKFFNGLGVKGELYLIPKHVMADVLGDEFTTYMSTRYVKEAEFKIMTCKGLWAIPGSDLAMAWLKGDSMVPNIEKFFPDSISTHQQGETYEYVTIRNTGGYPSMHHTSGKFREAIPTHLVGKTEMSDLITIDGQAKPGDSGSVVFSLNKTNANKPIVGIVSGTSKRGYTFISVVTRNVIDEFYAAILQGDVYPPDISVSPDPNVIETACTMIDPAEPVPPELAYDGRAVDYVAVITDKKFQCDPFQSSSFRPSPIKKFVDLEYPPTREPACVNLSDPRWVGYAKLTKQEHPLQHSLLKATNVKMTPLPEDDLDAAVEAVADYMRRELRVEEKPLRVYDVREAIHNDEDRMNPHTSSGFPYKATHPGKGKTALFRFDENGKIAHLDEDFERDCWDRFSKYCAGEAKPITTYVFAKDELRKKEKVFRARQIDVYPADENIVFRMLHQDIFSRMIQTGGGMHPWCIGIDVHSDWPVLASQLNTFGGKYCVDLDAKNWDGHMTWQIFQAVARATNKVYQDEYGPARLTEAANACSHCVQFGPYVYRKHQGMGSGWGGTTYYNTVGHWIIGYVNYRNIMREAWMDSPALRTFYPNLDKLLTFDTYLKLVIARYYSDDVVYAVSPIIAHIFTPSTIANAYARYGWEVTSADKGASSEGWKSLSEIQFLKRHFRYEENLGMWFGPLEFETIVDMVRYTRHNSVNNKIAQFIADYNDAADEVFYHGRTKYQTFLSGIKSMASQFGIDLAITPWKDRLMAYQIRAYNYGGRPQN